MFQNIHWHKQNSCYCQKLLLVASGEKLSCFSCYSVTLNVGSLLPTRKRNMWSGWKINVKWLLLVLLDSHAIHAICFSVRPTASLGWVPMSFTSPVKLIWISCLESFFPIHSSPTYSVQILNSVFWSTFEILCQVSGKSQLHHSDGQVWNGMLECIAIV